ncbi:MAG: ATP-grasp domain-containing protein, partial [bacterium]|nr:ATP-grasp domain-containing protein [bacterium]
MFTKVLVANRGEIAVRVIRACRELGVASVAVYSEADATAPYLRLADQAFPCGPAPARESYLDGEQILQIAVDCGAEAVHPGYGFLSENAGFADACVEAGLVFIGPSGDVMRQMGDKVLSRQTMQAAGMPIVPGATERLDDEAVAARCEEIGYPVMVKASSGGGGKGLRLVKSADELAKALPRARSESQSAFGDDGLYVEKWIESPRHIEIQVLADAHGNAIHAFERECSIQRRHQKVVEEAPAPQMTEELRARMGEAAVTATLALGYQSVGTFEFLVDTDDRFYFLEMNTRIQVEHAITEAITGLDLVKEMIRIAAGEPLS